MVDKVLARDLRRKGWSYQKIGSLFGVSRQRIEQVAGDVGKRRDYKMVKLLVSERRALNILRRHGFKAYPAMFHDKVDLWLEFNGRKFGIEVKERIKKTKERRGDLTYLYYHCRTNQLADYHFLILGEDWYFVPTKILPLDGSYHEHYSKLYPYKRKIDIDCIS